MSLLATGSIGKIACLLLLVLIATHGAHLPVLAHGAHDNGEQVRQHRVTGDPGIGDEHELRATSAHLGTTEATLANSSEQGVECTTTAATIPTRTDTLDAPAVPASIQFGADALSFSPACVVAPRIEVARRHLLLQVLLR